jgi:hypothetical protein
MKSAEYMPSNRIVPASLLLLGGLCILVAHFALGGSVAAKAAGAEYSVASGSRQLPQPVPVPAPAVADEAAFPSATPVASTQAESVAQQPAPVPTPPFSGTPAAADPAANQQFAAGTPAHGIARGAWPTESVLVGGMLLLAAGLLSLALRRNSGWHSHQFGR